MRTQLTTAAALCLALLAPPLAHGQDATELSLESLLNQSVSSASKFSQRIADAPSAVTVITAEDIRRMGAVDLPDVLRMVPGLNVRAKHTGSFTVSTRNDAGTDSPRMLVLLDGRVTTMELYSSTVWEAVTVTLDQIERIEVVRGPGSALYGANAFDGVISITTRRPTGGREVTGSLAMGEHGERRASAVYRQSMGAFRVDGFLQGRSTSPQENLLALDSTVHDRAVESVMGSVRLGWSNPAGVDLEVSGGAGNVKSLSYWGFGDLRSYDPTDTRFLNAQYRHPGMVAGAELRARASLTDRDVAGIGSGRMEAEVTLDRAVGAHRLIAGAVVTTLRGDSMIVIPEEYDQTLYGVYLQDVWAVSPAWELTAGLRYDAHPHSGGNVSPRGTLLFRPSQLHTVRMSAGRAFRNATPMENYFELIMPMWPGQNFVMLGSTALNPESVESLELGYIGSPHPRVAVTVDLFRNRIRDRVVWNVTESVTIPNVGLWPVRMEYGNVDGGNAYGGEAGVLYASDRLRLGGNYAYMHLNDADGNRAEWLSDHTLNAEVGVRPLRALWLNATYHYFTEADWSYLYGENVPPGTDVTVPARGVLHLNADAAVTRNLRASLLVQNVANDRYREILGGEMLGRRIVGSLSVTF